MQTDGLRPLGDLLRESIDDEMVERMCDRVEARRRAAPLASSRRPLVLVAAAAAILLIIAVAASLWSDGAAEAPSVATGPIQVVGGGALERVAVSASAAATERFELDDGSSVALSPGASLEAEVNTGRRVSLRLDRGRATFDVEPGGPRRWSIDAGFVLVEVVGTRFVVDAAPERVTVIVERGRVRVRGDRVEGGSRILIAGERLLLEPPEEPPPGEEAAAEVTPEQAASDGGAAEAGVAAWRRLASRGDWGGAYQQLGADGLRREAARADTMADLLSLADVARRSGHPAEAVAPLERGISSFPSDRRAAVAAFTLGRLETDQLRRHGRAARAFRRCLDLGPPAALQEDAFARLARAQARGGDYRAARRAAGEYLRRFPEGRHAEELSRWLQPR